MATINSGYQQLTAAGPAGIATLRVFGPAAPAFVSRHVRFRREAPRARGTLWRAELLDSDGEPIDDILVAGRSDGECDMCLHLHGSPWLVTECRRMVETAGLQERDVARHSPWQDADRLDAEAFALMPEMLTLRGVQWLDAQRWQLRSAIESVRTANTLEAARRVCRGLLARRTVAGWFSRPLRVAIVGPPNAGKSTLINALARDSTSIVSATPGTTRDWVEVPGEWRGLPISWLDTAGLREAKDAIEHAGIMLAKQLLAEADASVLVLDLSELGTYQPFLADWPASPPTCLALNKADRAGAELGAALAALPRTWRHRAVTISAAEHSNLAMLSDAVLSGAGRNVSQLIYPASFTGRQLGHVRAALRLGSPLAMFERLCRIAE